MTETIGERLKRAREERHLTVQQVAEATRLRPHYVEALERGDLSAIPSTTQARGFLRIYAGFLGLKPDELVPAARPPEMQPVPASPAPPTGFSTTPSEAASSPPSADTTKPRTNFLSGLRARLARRTPPPAPASPSAASESESSRPPTLAEVQAFVPVRTKEEFPAPAASAATPPPKPDGQATVTAASAKGTSARKAGAQAKTAKKPASKTDASSESGADRRTTPKKKVK